MALYPDRADGNVQKMLASLRTGHQAEARVYCALEEAFADREDVSCLWSLKLPNSARELDFLVVDRSLAMAVIEVKGAPLIPVGNGWAQIDPESGERSPYDRPQDPDDQLNAATAAVKRWFRTVVENPATKTPRTIAVIVLAGTSSTDLPEDSGLACHRADWRTRKSHYIVCEDEIDALPGLLRQWLAAMDPKQVAEATEVLWRAHGSLFGSTGCLSPDEAPEARAAEATGSFPWGTIATVATVVGFIGSAIGFVIGRGTRA